MGSISHALLMRHETLNPRDRPLCPDEEKALAKVAEQYNRFIGPALSAFRDLRTQEVISLIEAGAIPPWSSGAASDAEMARAAATLQRMGMNADDAKATSGEVSAPAEHASRKLHAQRRSILHFAYVCCPPPIRGILRPAQVPHC